MFARKFPKKHPMEGLKTRFVEQIWVALLPELGEQVMHQYLDPYDGVLWDISFIELLIDKGYSGKIHTIRASSRFKVGEKFEPKVWLDMPYKSKQIAFAPALEIKCLPTFEKVGNKIFINGDPKKPGKIAYNDGLTEQDFKCWFKDDFKGTVITWGNNPYL